MTTGWKIRSSGTIAPLGNDQFEWPLPCVPDALQPLFADNGVFAIVDAAKVFGLVEQLAASDLRHQCLFKGQARETWGDVAPWLVQLPSDHAFTRRLFTSDADTNPVNGLYDTQAAMFVVSDLPFDAVFAHLRKFNKVKTEDGRVLFLRYYDPVRFADLLDAIPHEQMGQIHGPLRFLCIQRDHSFNETEAT